MDAASILAFSSLAAETGAALWPGIVLIAGEEYAATVPGPKASFDLVPGASEASGTLTVRISAALLPTRPAEQQALKWKRPEAADWDAITWWIDEVRISPLDTEWQLICTPKN